MKFDLKYLVSIVLASMILVLPTSGCGGSGEATSVTEDADAAALAEYDRMMAEEEATAADDGSQ